MPALKNAGIAVHTPKLLTQLIWQLATAGLLAFSHNHARAQGADPDNQTTNTLGMVEVRAQREALSAASVQQATEELAQVPGGTAVVAAEDFAHPRAATIKDMLDFVPGVFAQSRVNEEARLSIRGSGLSRTFHLRGLRLLQDGVPINLADGGSDFQDIDPFALQHVEVFKGANALQYGSATLGGAINFVTPTGYTFAGSTFRADVGSYGERRLAIKSGLVEGPWDGFASLSRLQSDGFRDFSKRENTRLNANMGYRFTPGAETRFYFVHGDLNQELPGNLTLAQLRSNPRQANAANQARNAQRDFKITRLANKTSWTSPTGDIWNTGFYLVDKALYHPLPFGLIDQNNQDAGFFGQYNHVGVAFGKSHQFVAGWNVVRGNTDAKIFAHDRGVRTSLNSSEEQQSRNIELYAQSSLEVIDDTQLVTGIQATRATRQAIDEILSNGDQSYKRSYQQLSPKIGFLWKYTPEVQVFGNISRAFEPPTFSETSPTRALEAQTADTLEIGTRGKHGLVKWDISAYHSRLNNEFVTFLLPNPAFPGQSAILNADKTIHQGLELGLGGQVNPNWDWQIALTHGRFRFDQDPVYGDGQIPGIPDTVLKTRIDYTHASGWTAGPNIEYVPNAYPVDLLNTFDAPGYLLLGATAKWPLTKNARITLDARNLLNKKYAATTGVVINAMGRDTDQFAPGEGRSLFAGLEVNW